MLKVRGWTEAVDGQSHTHEVSFSDAQFVAEQADRKADQDTYFARMGETMRENMAAGLTYAAPPRVVLPGSSGSGAQDSFARMPDESILTVGKNGEVYLDAVRLGAARVSKLVQFGRSVFGHGATDGKWYRWTGLVWSVLDDFDASILK